MSSEAGREEAASAPGQQPQPGPQGSTRLTRHHPPPAGANGNWRSTSLPRNAGSWKLWKREGAVNSEIMNELIFFVEEAVEGGFTARALGESIFTEAETLDELRQQVRDAVRCHSMSARRLRSSASILFAKKCSPAESR